jgi:hypothetical protein
MAAMPVTDRSTDRTRPVAAPTVETIVTIETIYTPTALLSCGRVCIDFQWLLYLTPPAYSLEYDSRL